MYLANRKSTLNTFRTQSQSTAKALVGGLLGAAIVLCLTTGARAADVDSPFLPSPVVTASTVPTNGDVNPYGVAFVPKNFPAGGAINPGDVLVSNFNNSQNLQGTGTTIVRIQPNGATSLFFQGQAPLGLSTALNILQKGFILVGNFPSTDGTCGTATAGSILVINSQGVKLGTLTDPSIDGPWDSVLFDQGSTAKLFIANGLSGTIARLNLSVGVTGVNIQSATVIASGYMHQCDAATFVDAPTGLSYEAAADTLYVASTDDNAVFAVPNAGSASSDGGTGTIIYQDPTHLHGALAMAIASNGHLLVSNNDVINGDPNQPSEIVEFTKQGQFVKELSVDKNPGGSFGLAVQSSGSTAAFAAVDDNASTLTIWTVPIN